MTASPQGLRCIITGSGTYENVDDIRGTTNESTGSLALTLAERCDQLGIEVLLLAGRRLSDRLTDRKLPFRVVSFQTTAELAELLALNIAAMKPDMIFMAAAVSDFRPIPTAGKIPSDGDAPTITQEKTQKILPTLRELCNKAGVRTFITGFKLGSNWTNEELVSAARKQMGGAKTNLCFANDMAKLRSANTRHPAIIVTPEGGTIPIDGHRVDVARTLLDFVLKRRETQWFTTHRLNHLRAEPAPQQEALADRLVRFAIESDLLVDTNGNIAVSLSESYNRSPISLLISPRQINKATLTLKDLVPAEVDLQTRQIAITGDVKGSIDTGMLATVFARTNHQFAVHFHPGMALVAASGKTKFPYPCGTVEEADELTAAIEESIRRHPREWSPSSMLIELVNHGYYLGFRDSDDVQQFLDSWNRLRDSHRKHVRDVGLQDELENFKPAPIIIEGELVGLILHHKDGWKSLYIDRNLRSRGLSNYIFSQLNENRWKVGVHPSCNAAGFYVHRGYMLETMTSNGIGIYTPPVLRTDLKTLASICLINVATKSVLMVRTEFGKNGRDTYTTPFGAVSPDGTSWDVAQNALRKWGDWQHYPFKKPEAQETLYSSLGGNSFRHEVFYCFTSIPGLMPNLSRNSPLWVSLLRHDEEYLPIMNHVTRSIIAKAKELLKQN